MTTKPREVKRFLAHLAFVGALSVESTAQDMIDLNITTCRQFLEMKPVQILIVMGWLQGYRFRKALDGPPPAPANRVEQTRDAARRLSPIIWLSEQRTSS